MALAKNMYLDLTREHITPGFKRVATAAAPALGDGAQATAAYTFVKGLPIDWYIADADANATAIQFISTANGWTLPIDGQDADGVEIVPGGIDAWSGLAFTVGTDAAFFVRATLKLTTLANIDNLLVGFRRAGKGSNTGAFGAYTGELANIATVYDDFAYIGVGDNLGAFITYTELNDAVTTSTTLAHAAAVSAEFMSLEVKVSAAGVVTYRLGTGSTVAAAKAALAADASAVAYTFDSTDILLPSIVCGATAAGAPNVQLATLEVGYQDTN